MSCSGAAWAISYLLARGEAERAHLLGGGAADAVGVLLGLVVAVLGGEREPPEDLELRVLQLPTALAHPVLEAGLQPPHVQQVAHPKRHLELVERLGEEVAGPLGERPAPRLEADVRGQDHDRDPGPVQPLRLQASHELEPVELGHMEVEQDQLRLELRAEGLDAGRIAGSRDVLEALPR